MRRLDATRIVAEVAAKHSVLVEENDPLMVALTANGVFLETLARELIAELQEVAERLEKMSVKLPTEATAALEAAAKSAATSVRSGLESDIESAGLKARAIVDVVYRAQSRRTMWMWIAIGLLTGACLFCGGIIVGYVWWR